MRMRCGKRNRALRSRLGRAATTVQRAVCRRAIVIRSICEPATEATVVLGIATCTVSRREPCPSDRRGRPARKELT